MGFTGSPIPWEFTFSAWRQSNFCTQQTLTATEKLNRRDREIEMEIKIAQLKHTYHGPLDIVRIAVPTQRLRTPEQEARFESRWKSVLKSFGSEKKP
jgi:hypothetical protein